MRVPFKFIAKCMLVQLYSARAQMKFTGLLGESLSSTNSYMKALAWLTKKQLVRKGNGNFIITTKGRHYVDKKELLNDPLYRNWSHQLKGER